MLGDFAFLCPSIVFVRSWIIRRYARSWPWVRSFGIGRSLPWANWTSHSCCIESCKGLHFETFSQIYLPCQVSLSASVSAVLLRQAENKIKAKQIQLSTIKVKFTSMVLQQAANCCWFIDNSVLFVSYDLLNRGRTTSDT